MKISVIIPTYKPQAYLWECLDSLAVQTFPKKDFHVILVLNGCKEPYERDIRSWIAEHPNLQANFIQTDQGGVSNARNIALDVAKGEYITFIDDDDYISPSYLEELYNKASLDTISLCYPYAFNDGKPQMQLDYGITNTYSKRSPYGKQPYPRSRKFFSGPCMKLIPMSFIQGRRFDTNFNIGEDCLFNFLISDNFKFVNYTSTNAIYYRRIRANSAITAKRDKKEFIKLNYKAIKEYIKIYRSGRYNTYLFITRFFGCLWSMWCTLIRK